MSKKPWPLGAPNGRTHTLHPGDVVCAQRGDRLETLLGSCIAVILTDPRRTVGAMCHIVHASPAPRPSPASSTYADAALEAMYGLLTARGITPSRCEAYVYGGGNMFPAVVKRAHIGDTNSRAVLDALGREGIRVLEREVGGTAYRKLAWTVGPGAPQVTAVPM